MIRHRIEPDRVTIAGQRISKTAPQPPISPRRIAIASAGVRRAIRKATLTWYQKIGGLSMDVHQWLNRIVQRQQGRNTVPVDIDGGIEEYQWLSTDAAPTLAATDRAFGVIVNAATHELTVNYWTGAAWQEVS